MTKLRSKAIVEQQAAERRSSERHKLILRVGLLEHEGKSVFCLVKNISSAGVQVKPYSRVAKGSTITLRVGDESPIPGTVSWYRDGLAGIRAVSEPFESIGDSHG